MLESIRDIDAKAKIAELRNINCAEDDVFFQAMEEVLLSILPLFESDEVYTKMQKHAIVQRLIVPDRILKFKVTWLDDNQQVHVNKGYRVQFNNALGPYKGGLRFHPSVNEGILKFLGFEQILKNALTGLPIGGGKGGSDFDPRGKSDFEVMKFCTAFMKELYKYIGPRIDVPAGDIGVGGREIGYLFSEYKKMTHSFEGVLTGKPDFFGGSLMRPEATGYGVIYFTKRMLELENKESLKGKICTVSGSGNVALHAIEKLQELGATVVTCTDSKGMIYDEKGLDLRLLKELKFIKRGSLEAYKESHPQSIYTSVSEYPKDAHAVWNIPCYAAFPCATQNELTLTDAKNLITNGCQAVAEGANMPSTADAVHAMLKSNISLAPAKAANAGGVATSAFEMSQNASMTKWSFEEVDKKLQETMIHICETVAKTAKDYGVEGNYVDGANIAGFKKVADAMMAEAI
ncbi:NADP-specific glutamate dehydrogenase [hydrothermal vent metagenome]|uniref:NADP-specific glutamate dehydrogenase n=1 Tax=hydrothermal vent metagenome TaxID=652676 RepID=A0A1W1BGM4_9ZZZZ